MSILKDRVRFCNAEAYDTSKNLEFGYGHPLFLAKWRETKFRELSQEGLLAEFKDTLEKAQLTKIMAITIPCLTG